MKKISKTYTLSLAAISRLEGKNAIAELDQAISVYQNCIERHLYTGNLEESIKCIKGLTLREDQVEKLETMCPGHKSKVLNLLLENYYWWIDEAHRRKGEEMEKQIIEDEKICTLSVYADKKFIEAWKNNTRKSADIVKEIVENINEYSGIIYEGTGDKKALTLTVRRKERNALSELKGREVLNLLAAWLYKNGGIK